VHCTIITSVILINVVAFIQEDQPLDTVPSLAFALYSSSFSHFKNGSRGKIRRDASK
jgi:hypothetical protein